MIKGAASGGKRIKREISSCGEKNRRSAKGRGKKWSQAAHDKHIKRCQFLEKGRGFRTENRLAGCIRAFVDPVRIMIEKRRVIALRVLLGLTWVVKEQVSVDPGVRPQKLGDLVEVIANVAVERDAQVKGLS